MRGHYYDGFSGKAIKPTDNPTLVVAESTEDRNARENTALHLSGKGPQIIVSPSEPASGADIAAIVQAVALRILQGELDWDETILREYHPTLRGITRAQLDAVIAEGLA